MSRKNIDNFLAQQGVQRGKPRTFAERVEKKNEEEIELDPVKRNEIYKAQLPSPEEIVQMRLDQEVKLREMERKGDAKRGIKKGRSIKDVQ